MASSGISMSGLISGLDSASLISQIMSIERQPETRMKERISELTSQKSAIKSLRTQLLGLRSRAQDFRLNLVFDQYASTTSEDTVLTSSVSGSNPVSGSYEVEVKRLASATVANSSASLGGAINPAAALNDSGIATTIDGTKFSINGIEFTIDPDTQSLNDIIGMVNGSAAGVTMSYDAATDRLSVKNTNAGDTALINFSQTDDGDTENDSNILDVLALMQATQSTDSNGSTSLTSTRNLGAIDAADLLKDVNFKGGAITAGTFTINGVTITIDPTQDSISEILGRINDSTAQVTASYDTSSDTIRMVSKTLGSRTIRFQAGTSNFLNVTNLTTATQVAGNDSQFTINGGAVQTRNTNEVADAVGGVTLKLLSVGKSTVTVSPDDDAIVEKVTSFIDDYNESVTQLHDLTTIGGLAAGDGSLRLINDFLRNSIFSNVAGITGSLTSLADVGVTTGDSFDSSAVSQLTLDEDSFRKALREGRANVEELFLEQRQDRRGPTSSLTTSMESPRAPASSTPR